MCMKRYKITLLVLLVDTKYIKRMQALIEKRYKIAICVYLEWIQGVEKYKLTIHVLLVDTKYILKKDTG